MEGFTEPRDSVISLMLLNKFDLDESSSRSNLTKENLMIKFADEAKIGGIKWSLEDYPDSIGS